MRCSLLHMSLAISGALATYPTHSKGCGKPLPPGISLGGPSANFTVYSRQGGGERRYLLHLPGRFSRKNDRPAPVVMAFHGFGQTTASMEEITRLSDGEVNGEAVVVYPEGVNNVWLGDPGAHNLTTLDDRPFISDLLTHLTSTLCLDPTRIYATGFSNGGGMTGLLACYPPTADRIAAFAGVAAAYYTQGSLGYSLFERGTCPRRESGWNHRPRPFLHIHGGKDMVIAYSGDNSGFDLDQNGIPDPDTLAIRSWLRDWAWRNGCPDSAKPEVRVARELAGDIVEESWTCKGREDVVVGYKVAGLGHGWPSTVRLDEGWEEFRLGPQKWNASGVLLEWFERWRVD